MGLALQGRATPRGAHGTQETQRLYLVGQLIGATRKKVGRRRTASDIAVAGALCAASAMYLLACGFDGVREVVCVELHAGLWIQVSVVGDKEDINTHDWSRRGA